MNSDIEGDPILTSNYSAKLGFFDVVASSAYPFRPPNVFCAGICSFPNCFNWEIFCYEPICVHWQWR